MMGAGKTAVGKCLAELSSRTFADTDARIEEKYGEISAIFKTLGEARFREMEREIAREVAKEDGLVLATGGGFFLSKENAELVKRKGKTIYLRATVKTLKARLVLDTQRPLLQGEEDLEQKLERLLRERASIYEAVANEIVDVDGKSVEEIAKEILKRLNG